MSKAGRTPATLLTALALVSLPLAVRGQTRRTELRGGGDAQMEALASLRARSETPVQTVFEDGRLRFVRLDVAVAPDQDLAPAGRAMAFLEENARLFGLLAPRESLIVSRLLTNDSGDHVFFDQHLGGIPVLGARIAVHLHGTRVTAANGWYVTGTSLNRVPGLSSERATAVALRAVGKGSRLLGQPRLVYYEVPGARSKDAPAVSETRLAYQLTATGGEAARGWSFVIDAVSGAVVSKTPTDRDAKNFWIRTANNAPEAAFCNMSMPTDWFLGTTQVTGSMPDAEGIASFTFANQIYDFYSNTLGRSSWDGTDGQIRINLDDSDQAGNAAFASLCGHFVFGNNMATKDVMAHEFTHGVTDKTAGFAFSFQPGSLDESYADVFGAIIDSANWTIGEGSAIGVIRSLSNPPVRSSTLSFDCGPLPFGTGCATSFATVAHPDRMSMLIQNATNDVSGDFGARHANAGIPNKAAFLIAAGGTHNGITVTGIGRTKLAKLYYEVLTSFLVSGDNFASAASATIMVAQAAANVGRHGFTASDACVVVNAFAAVELAAADLDCDGIPDALDPDVDGDGVPDVADNCPRVGNPGQADSDGDGAGNACDADLDNDGVPNASDNCPTTPNSGQADLDKDGMGDVCDDSDGDSVKDNLDNCPWNPNPLQQNSDSDPYGNACDKDADNDGYCQVGGQTIFSSDVGVPVGGCPAASDNCPLTYNPSQADADGDGRGDACDQCPNNADTGLDTDGDGIDNACDPDDDNDGVPDGQDNCPTVKNPNQTDWNGNGIGQACDPDEQLKIQRGPLELAVYLRDKLDRFQVIELPVLPDPRDPLFDWVTGQRVALSIEADAPVTAMVIDDQGRSLGVDGPSTHPVVTFTPGGDFCALPVGAEVKGGELGPVVQRTYFLRVSPQDSLAGALQIRGGLADPFVPTPGKPMPGDGPRP